jgi:hypothetical protein
MFGRRVKLDAELYERARKHAEGAGYSSLEEFVAHALEKEMNRTRDDDPEEQVRRRLQGLGYLS